MSFEQFKESAMRKYKDAKKEGLVDKDLIKYLDKFNTLKDYYTTSSCSGRVMLVKNIEGTNKTPGSFYFKSHSIVKYSEALKAIREFEGTEELWLKSESFILHVGCRTIENADKLLKYCQLKGIKRAGVATISRRIIVEIIGTQSIAAIIEKDGKILASEEYIKVLIEKSNKKLAEAKRIVYDFLKDYKRIIA